MSAPVAETTAATVAPVVTEPAAEPVVAEPVVAAEGTAAESAVVVRKRRVGPKSSRKQAAIRCNIRVTAWQTAAKKHGFIQKGAFVKIPKRGTPEYEAIKETQRQLENEWTTNGGVIPEQCKLREPAPPAVAATAGTATTTEEPTKKRKRSSKKKQQEAVPEGEVPAPAPAPAADAEKPKPKRKRAKKTEKKTEEAVETPAAVVPVPENVSVVVA